MMDEKNSSSYEFSVLIPQKEFLKLSKRALEEEEGEDGGPPNKRRRHLVTSEIGLPTSEIPPRWKGGPAATAGPGGPLPFITAPAQQQKQHYFSTPSKKEQRILPLEAMFPVDLKDKMMLLLEMLESVSEFDWDRNTQVIKFLGQEIPGSNIADVLLFLFERKFIFPKERAIQLYELPPEEREGMKGIEIPRGAPEVAAIIDSEVDPQTFDDQFGQKLISRENIDRLAKLYASMRYYKEVQIIEREKAEEWQRAKEEELIQQYEIDEEIRKKKLEDDKRRTINAVLSSQCSQQCPAIGDKGNILVFLK